MTVPTEDDPGTQPASAGSLLIKDAATQFNLRDTLSLFRAF
jgi:hypothetical protein